MALELPKALGVEVVAGESGVETETGEVHQDGDEGCEEGHEEQGSCDGYADRPQNRKEDMGLTSGEEHTQRSGKVGSDGISRRLWETSPSLLNKRV